MLLSLWNLVHGNLFIYDIYLDNSVVTVAGAVALGILESIPIRVHLMWESINIFWVNHANSVVTVTETMKLSVHI